jgi:vitamin B12 transporter
MRHVRVRMHPASFFDAKGEAFSLILRAPYRCLPVILLVVTFAALRVPALSQQDSTRRAPQDSLLRTYLLNEVIVTTQRIPRPALTSPAFTNVLSRRDIDASGGTSLASVLGPAEGLFLKDYGGPSGLKTISQRGLGTEHTLLLLNGMPVNSVHNGGFDLGLLSSYDIGRIEVVHGGQSALHGANAVAGVVNVLTRTMDEGETIAGGMTVGPFGYRHYHAAAGNAMLPSTWRVSIAREQSTENFPFVFRNGPQSLTLVRQNADVAANRLSASFTAPLSPRLHLSSFVALLDAERGVPGIVVGPFSSSKARQADRTGLLQATVTATPSSIVTWETRVQGQYGYQRYRDPDLMIGFAPVDNYLTSREIHIESHAGIEAGGGLRLYVGGDLALIRAEGNTYRDEVSRTRWGVALAGEQRLLGVQDAFHVSLFPAIRYDRASAIMDAWSPQLGLFVNIPVEMPFLFSDAALRMRAMASRNFRAPTFNEMFYAGGGGIGNPYLRPERSGAYEVGLGWSGKWLGEHHLEITGFVIGMKDRIVWVSAPGGNVTPRNLRTVDARGIELSYVLITGDLRFTVHYARRRTEKMSEDYPGDPNTHVQVIYTPQETAGMQGSWSVDPGIPHITAIDFFGGYGFIGHRYITEDNHDFLPGYQVFSAGCGVHVSGEHVQVHLRLQVENMLDVMYEVMAGYPMPPRTARLSVDVSY